MPPKLRGSTRLPTPGQEPQALPTPDPSPAPPPPQVPKPTPPAKTSAHPYSPPREARNDALNPSADSRTPAPPADSPNASLEPVQHVTIEVAKAVDSANPQPYVTSAGVQPPPGAFVPNIHQKTAFWEAYNKTGDVEDKEFVASSGGDLDVLLIFAGLFSAVNTSFIIESYKALKADPVDETNKLLRSVLLTVQNSSSAGATDIDTEQFAATSRDIKVNICFFLSLCCSLCAAFGAVLAKQWLTQYDRDGGGGLKPLSERGRERQLKYEARGKWGLDHVIATLPTLLQFSLFFFLVGLVDFVWILDTIITYIVIAFTSLAFLFYITTTSISLIDPSSPFQTRFSALLRSIWSVLTITSPAAIRATFHRVYWDGALGLGALWYRRRWEYPIYFLHLAVILVWKGILRLIRWLANHTSFLRRMEVEDLPAPSMKAESRCIAYLLERMTRLEDLEILADAMEGMPEGSDPDAVVEALFTFHLKPTPGELWHFGGLSGPNWKPLLKMLQILFARWGFLENPGNTVITPSLPLGSNLFLCSLCPELWRVALRVEGDLEAYGLICGTLAALPQRQKDLGTASQGALTKWRNETLTSFSRSGDSIQEDLLALLCSITAYISSSSYFWVDKISQLAWHNLTGIRPTLSSTMWVDTSQMTANTNNFWMGVVRMQVLPSNPSDDLLSSGFAQHLALFFTHYAKPGQDPHYSDLHVWDTAWLYCSYIVSIRRLLTSKDVQEWSKELAKYGHLSCLHAILRDYSERTGWTSAELPLHSFLCLWAHNTMATPGPADSARAPSPYMTTDWVQVVVSVLVTRALDIRTAAKEIVSRSFDHSESQDSSGHNRQWLLPEMEQMMKWLFSYLEAAIQSGLVKRKDLKLAVDGYGQWCKTMDEELPSARTKELSGRLEIVARNFGEEERGDLGGISGGDGL